APAFAPLAHLDAAARLDLSARLSADGTLLDATAILGARAGALDLGAGRRIPIAGLDAAAEWRPGELRVPRATIRLDGPGTPVLAARAEASQRDGSWTGRAEATLDAAPLAYLARWWPEGLGSGERDWILSNITAGTARNGRWTVEAEAGPDLAGFRITALAGTMEVADATVHWLRPIPPVEAAAGRVEFSLTEVTARVSQARQSGTAVQARDAVLRFLFAPDSVPSAEMEIGLAGPVPQVLGVLQHPRLRLFERRPLALKDPQGTLEGRVTLGFPLLSDLPVEQLRVRAQGRLRDVRISDLLLGRNLERGQFELNVDTAGLRVSGTATLAEIQARLGVEMDFRPGPAAQVVMRETVQARADVRQLAALGLASEQVAQGPVGLDVRTERRRNGAGRVTVRADLREATLELGPVGWGKPPGQNAGGDAVLRLAGESLEAIENFRIEAPGLLLRGNAAFGRGTRLERVTIADGQVEASRFTGEARPPARPDAPWTVAIRGALLDLRRA
uniref:YhdP family protein n=1 Tax=Falsiroseomonas oryziterrae TaxID=2911368 RepID=UPI002351934B